MDYKEGHAVSIEFFVDPFVEFISQVLQQFPENAVRLIPVPSSVRYDSPKYKRTPKKRGDARNRDDRNIVFCDYLSKKLEYIISRNCLIRTISKDPKERWSPSQHAKSIKFNNEPKPAEGWDGILILIDDVSTTGNTLDGAEIVLRRKYPDATILKLAIATTRDPNAFEEV